MSASAELDPRVARLARVTALICLGDRDGLRQARLEAPPGEPDRGWREAVLQSHLFAGFPRLVEAHGVLASAGGLGQPEPDEIEGGEIEGGGIDSGGLDSDGIDSDGIDSGGIDSDGPFFRRGEELFDRIYGAGADQVRELLAGYHPDLAGSIAGHAYGRILARPGLDAASRELCAVAALFVTDQERQLASHARGAVRCGASRGAVLELPALLEDLVPGEVLERGRAVIERFARATD